MTTEDIEKLVTGEAEESELTRGLNDDLLAGRGVHRNRALATHTLNLRITDDVYKQLGAIADDRGVTVSTLVRGFIEVGLAELRGTSVPDVVARLSTLVEQLRVNVGQ